VTAPDGRALCRVEPEAGGWRAAVVGGPHAEPVRSLVVGAVLAADVL
jgi:hypothetical protein